jgi:probable HAF family extracellular repeat protein
MTDLGTVPGDFSSVAFAIDNLVQVVGLSWDQSGNCRAFLWQNGTMTDLNALTPVGSSLYLLGASDINSRGEIVSIGLDQSTGEPLAFLAVPTVDGRKVVPSQAQSRERTPSSPECPSTPAEATGPRSASDNKSVKLNFHHAHSASVTHMVVGPHRLKGENHEIETPAYHLAVSGTGSSRPSQPPCVLAVHTPHIGFRDALSGKKA